jgi:hypothetical protein
MDYANRVRQVTVAAVAAGALAVAGTVVAISSAAVTQVAPAKQARGQLLDSNNAQRFIAKEAQQVRLWLNLAPMPTGTVTTGTTPAGQQFVQVNAFGLTPGSAHTVTLGGSPIGTLTANGAGQVVTTFNVPAISPYDEVRILNAGPGTSVIAVTPPTIGTSNGPYPLQAVEAGFPLGSLRGYAALVYNPWARTITVTVTASGFTPGAHAAHIHLGSCSSQGPILYPLMDFIADKHGDIVNETRVVTDAIMPPATGWYLNLHQGNSENILNSQGQPTIFFRPLLCANIAPTWWTGR